MVPSHGILVGENLFYLFFCVRHTPWLLDRFFSLGSFCRLKESDPKKNDLVRALCSKNTEKTVIWRDNGLFSIKAKLNCWRGNAYTYHLVNAHLLYAKFGLSGILDYSLKNSINAKIIPLTLFYYRHFVHNKKKDNSNVLYRSRWFGP